MISERDLSRGFSAFWQELLPLLTPRFMRVFNEGYTKVLLGGDGRPLAPVPVGAERDHPAIVAEMAFFLAGGACKNGQSVIEASQRVNLVNAAADMACKLVDQYEGLNPAEAVCLSMGEQSEAIEIAKSYDALYLHCGLDVLPHFSPRIPGAGFLTACEADLAIGDTLFEIKTVNRNIGGRDFRQLIIYLALQAATGDRRWSTAGFFNPRRRTIAQFSVDNVLFRLSGGKSPSQVFDELIRFVSTRDTQFDTSF